MKLGFIQDIDYIVKKFDYSKMSNQKGRGGDRRSETYLVTVETAKHLAMMANEIAQQAKEKKAQQRMEQGKEIYRLHTDGYTIESIAKKLGMSEPTAYRLQRAYLKANPHLKVFSGRVAARGRN